MKAYVKNPNNIDSVWALLKVVEPSVKVEIFAEDTGESLDGVMGAGWLKDKGFIYHELDIKDFKMCDDIVNAWVYVRRCSECGEIMYDGFMVDGGWEYYCSEECLHKHYTEEEWDEMYGDGDTDSCWTTWY